MIRALLQRPKEIRQKRRRQGFTLLEVLLSIAILVAIFLIVGNAIDIPAVLLGTHDSKRKHDVREIENAMYQHVVKQWEVLNNTQIPECTEANASTCAKPICRKGVTAGTCVNLDGLTPDFLPDIPLDPAETNLNHTGYLVYKVVGRPRIKSAYLGTLPGN